MLGWINARSIVTQLLFTGRKYSWQCMQLFSHPKLLFPVVEMFVFLSFRLDSSCRQISDVKLLVMLNYSQANNWCMFFKLWSRSLRFKVLSLFMKRFQITRGTIDISLRRHSHIYVLLKPFTFFDLLVLSQFKGIISASTFLMPLMAFWMGGYSNTRVITWYQCSSSSTAARTPLFSHFFLPPFVLSTWRHIPRQGDTQTSAGFSRDHTNIHSLGSQRGELGDGWVVWVGLI